MVATARCGKETAIWWCAIGKNRILVAKGGHRYDLRGKNLDTEAPYLTVRRAWHTEHNRPIILTDLKTKAAERNIPLPDCLAECLKEAKKKSTSDYVVANRDGEPLSYTQFKQFWKYIVTRTAKPRIARKPVNGKYEKYMLYPELGKKARNNSHVVYSLDFEVTPHMLRHTYITNLIHSSVDPKTVQYLAGHKSSKITILGQDTAIMMRIRHCNT